MVRRTRIGPDGSVIKDGDEGGDAGGAGSGGRGGGSGRRWPCAVPRQIDTFGFLLAPKHFALVLLFVSLTMGGIGMVLFASLLSMYTYFQRRSPPSSGGGSRWKDGKALGANVKGVGDLPKAPKGG